MGLDAAVIGDTAFSSGLDGTGNAVGKYIQLTLSKALAAGEQALAGC
jgi:hypothetical protein